jgi:hypothetical protein
METINIWQHTSLPRANQSRRNTWAPYYTPACGITWRRTRGLSRASTHSARGSRVWLRVLPIDIRAPQRSCAHARFGQRLIEKTTANANCLQRVIGLPERNAEAKLDSRFPAVAVVSSDFNARPDPPMQPHPVPTPRVPFQRSQHALQTAV